MREEQAHSLTVLSPTQLEPTVAYWLSVLNQIMLQRIWVTLYHVLKPIISTVSSDSNSVKLSYCGVVLSHGHVAMKWCVISCQ